MLRLINAQPQRIDAEFEKAAKELKKLARPKRQKPCHINRCRIHALKIPYNTANLAPLMFLGF